MKVLEHSTRKYNRVLVTGSHSGAKAFVFHSFELWGTRGQDGSWEFEKHVFNLHEFC